MAFWARMRVFNLHWIANIGLAVGVGGQFLSANAKFRDAICFFGPGWCLALAFAGAFGTVMAYLGRPHSIASDPKKP